MSFEQPRRIPTYPSRHSTRRKPRRCPLVLRFVKGAVHVDIFVPVLLHTAFAAVVVYASLAHPSWQLHLPSSLIPALSIVVGLILVFRNSTSYDRFWTGQKQLNVICSCIRNLSRSFLVNSFAYGKDPPSQAERVDTETVLRSLLAFVYAVKSHLRLQWHPIADQFNGERGFFDRLVNGDAVAAKEPEYDDLLPSGVGSLEDQGLGMPVEISVLIEAYIQRGTARGWFHGPQASQLTVQLNTAIAAFGSMETIRHTPIPVAYLIHIRQVLAVFGMVLPFAMVEEMGWWAVLLTALIIFTLYGIEGIGQQLEDPFGYDKNDIKMDAVVEDLRVELTVLIEQWKTGGTIFRGM
ncbi:hypothetical protein K461DRAFT_284863 [Myriangium duriaei CBS 260.36]|uniref:Bestrophin n=1 Tax=Myriangium duriaei CBS 260.36 TaxID=1168546 RepID=A0A9P4J7Q6_9PEZI|nr:hypothetical protein K461DRAFT_284863 [Myriangium duriaei CBS 260.36]